jgi:hypothetical protein
MASPTSKSSQFMAAEVLAFIVSLSAVGIPMNARAQLAADPCAKADPPAGAQSLGYVRRVFCVAPTLADITDNDAISAKLYSGSWYNKSPAPLSLYSMSGGMLVLTNGGGVITETRRSSTGALPMLLGSAGFYVEFAERLSDNDPDHWPAVWLMPQEHNARHDDHVAGDPSDYERWMELDVDEGGFNAGHHGSLINWYGKHPNYEHQNFGNDPSSTFGMDRTQEHIFGLSYDPTGKKVTWWVDGAAVGSVSSASVPSIVNNYHYYLIIGNQNHGANRPYKMYVRYFSAWSTSVFPNPPSGVRAVTPP